MSDSNEQNSSPPEPGCCSFEQVNFNEISARCIEVLKEPTTIWSKIKSEATSIKDIYITYLIPLVVAGALCMFIGTSLVGIDGVRVPVVSGFIGALVDAVRQLVFLFILAFTLSRIAPRFEGGSDELSSFKLVAYSMTALFLAELLWVIPVLHKLAIIAAFYSLYTFYAGIPTMLNIPEHRRVPFFVTSIIGMIVIGLLGYAVAGVLSGSPLVPGSGT